MFLLYGREATPHLHMPTPQKYILSTTYSYSSTEPAAWRHRRACQGLDLQQLHIWRARSLGINNQCVQSATDHVSQQPSVPSTHTSTFRGVEQHCARSDWRAPCTPSTWHQGRGGVE